ncbi:MAG: polyribonucleotide nucleotidyltransferase [Candidatus Marinimicrobia bacterium]|nr:polyribonucleotide nucleotidyltransferase [Candidatus Neomarinimicrobiota bacterium]|tara:strand:- start:5311 stop:7488 length:2178 start_codon:yes stop_codon:yes gene_type:complete
MQARKQTIDLAGKTLTLETGVMAKQSAGSVTVQYGDTIILCAVNAANDSREGIDFFPLSVEYRERFYAAGKIPGGYFKREGRPAEKEILSARLTDRPIRPLFPKEFRCETQVMINLLSTDQETPADILGTIGSSVALLLSDIPWNGPVGAVRIGYIDGKPLINPTFQQIEESKLDLVMTGTEEAIIMMEAEAKEIAEDEILTAVQYGHEVIKDIVKFQHDFVKGIAKPKRELNSPEHDPALVDAITAKVNAEITSLVGGDAKDDRRKAVADFKKNITESLEEQYPECGGLVKAMTDDAVKKEIRRRILVDGKRSDGRSMDEIRPISMIQGVLPRAHGSSLFTRGETQSLATVTLGTKSDEQFVDDLDGEFKKRYMLHYNFPPFSVGEVRRYLGVSRREVGHGNLAERALQFVMPEFEDFPYTVRLVSDILESNGSSSMATVCSGSLALMNAGVPIKSHVAGISVGLVTGNDKEVLMTDILGEEDHFGDMDFKVAGTRDGITSMQVDLKIAGLSMELVKKVFERAYKGRQFILDKMEAELGQPNSALSEFAPKIDHIQIDPEKIGGIIGPGGKMIRAIQADCECEVEVDDDGIVVISSLNAENNRKAREKIEAIVREPEVGMVFEGEVKRIMNFGAFIEFSPGREGLCHISELNYERTEKVEDVVNIGDVVKVKIIKVDDMNRIDVSLRALKDPPEGWVEPPKRERKPQRRGSGPGGRRSGGRHRR